MFGDRFGFALGREVNTLTEAASGAPSKAAAVDAVDVIVDGCVIESD